MSRARFRMALAWVFGVVAIVFVVLGVVVSPVALGVGVPFGIAAYILWYQASGRLQARVRWSRTDQRQTQQRQQTTGATHRHRSSTRDRNRESVRRDDGPALDRAEAYRVLGVSENADPATVRRAYRERVKDVHPDRGGDEAQFKRVSKAYERLREEGRA